MSKTSIFDAIPRSSHELSILRDERTKFDLDYIPFDVGDEVICIYSEKTTNLRDGYMYVIEKETKDTVFIKIDTGDGKSYWSEYKKRRFTFPSLAKKVREIKIDSIV